MSQGQTDRRRRALAIFEDVVDLGEAARRARLDAACAGDPMLRAQVEALLAADASQDEPFAGDGAQWIDALAGTGGEEGAEAAMTGRSIGAWRLVGILGHGGMGAVHAVERDDGAYAQRAALKLIRSAADSPAARERFLRERQTLAGLQHPHIASLLDGGFTAEGDPYFVMEYVDGEPIDRWCDARMLGLRERVRLFLQVLDAVQYAHRHLVVHRDLKPSNLLVSADGQVKLLDFGIAKQLEAAEATRTAERALTFEYASPEQLHDAPITTATDVWQLGIVLHRLLSGAHPFGLDRDTPLARQLQQLESAPQPLARAAAAATAGQAAARAATTPAALARSLRGGLSAVVETCLRREPAARYASVEAIAADLRAWLDDRPVAGGGLGRRERLRLWLRRNRVLAASAAAVAVALLAGAGVALWQAHEARQQAQLAAAEAARAELEATNARASLAVLTETLAGMNPNETLDTRVSVRALLEHAQEKLQAQDAEPGVRQPVQRMLATLYAMRGDFATAIPLYEAGLAGVEPRGRREALALADDLANYSSVLGALERGEESFAAAQRAAALRERHAADDPAQQVMAAAELAYAHYRHGDHAAAERYWRRGIELAGAMAQPPIDDAMRMHNQLSIMLSLDGRPAEGLPVARAGLDFADRHGVPAGAPVRSQLLRALSDAQAGVGDASGAEQSIRQAIALGEKFDGPESPVLATLYNSLGLVLGEQGRHRDAIEALQRSLALDPGGAFPVDAAIRTNNLAGAYEAHGDYPRALALYAQALAGLERAEGDVEAQRRRVGARQARASGLAGEPAAAYERIEVLRQQAREAGEAETIEYGFVTVVQAGAAWRAADPARGERLLDEAGPLLRKHLPGTHPLFVQIQQLRAGFARQRGDLAAAAKELEAALEASARAGGSNPFTEATLRADLAAVRQAQGQADAARALLGQALPVMRAVVLPQQVDRKAAEALAARL